MSSASHLINQRKICACNRYGSGAQRKQLEEVPEDFKDLLKKRGPAVSLGLFGSDGAQKDEFAVRLHANETSRWLCVLW